MLTRIKIEDLYGVSGDVNGLRKINVFLGLNGSGKTTALKALYFSADRRRRTTSVAYDFLGKVQPWQDFEEISDDEARIRFDGHAIQAYGKAPRVERAAFISAASVLDVPQHLTAQKAAEGDAFAMKEWASDVCAALRGVFPEARIESVIVGSVVNAKPGDEVIAIKVAGDDLPVSPRRFGDGFIAALHIIAVLTAMRRTAHQGEALALFDVVDGFFSPVTIDRLMNAVAKIVDGVPIQVAFAAHGIDIPAWTACAIDDGTIAEEDVAVFLMKKSDDAFWAHPFLGRSVRAYFEFFGDVRLIEADSQTSMYRLLS